MNPVRNVEKKLDRCVRLLEELNMQMRDLRKQNSVQNVTFVPDKAAPSPEKMVDREARPESSNNTSNNTLIPEEIPVAVPEVKAGFNVDKYGRVYTEEEIQKIILD